MILPTPDKTEVKIEHHTCSYHKAHPQDRSWPGCTCGGSYSMKVLSYKQPWPLIPDNREIIGDE